MMNNSAQQQAITINTLPKNAPIKSINKSLIYILLTVALLILSQTMVYLLANTQGSFPLERVSLLSNTTSSDEISEVITKPESDWNTLDEIAIDNGVVLAWLRVEVPQEAAKIETFLRFTDPLMDSMVVYQVAQNNLGEQVINSAKMGDTQAFEHRVLALPNIVVPLQAYKNGYTLYIKGESRLAVTLDVSQWKLNDFIVFNDVFTLFFGILFGYILALTCYSLMMLASSYRSQYLWYCAYLCAFCLQIFAVSGFGFQYLWPEGIRMQSIMASATGCLTIFALVKFTSSLLPTIQKFYQHIFNLIAYSLLAIIVIVVFSAETWAIKLGAYSTLALSIVMVTTCIFMAVKGNSEARFFAFIWVILSATAVMSILVRFHLVTLDTEPLFILVQGFYLESLVMGVALISNFKRHYQSTQLSRKQAFEKQAQSVKAKNKLVKMQGEAKSNLEEQVKRQTMQLEMAISELSQTSIELENMRKLDSLTSLPNRLAFDEKLEKLSAQALGRGLILSIAVLDIDHFKKINDGFGHLVGDDCLRLFAKLFKQDFENEHSMLCRFGGEEFLLASIQHPSTLTDKLEQFRARIEAESMETPKGDVKLTVSIGIASSPVLRGSEKGELFKKADENLYRAKQKGRNLIVA